MEQFAKAFVALVLVAVLAFTAITISKFLGKEAIHSTPPSQEGCLVDARPKSERTQGSFSSGN